MPFIKKKNIDRVKLLKILKIQLPNGPRDRLLVQQVTYESHMHATEKPMSPNQQILSQNEEKKLVFLF